MKLIKANINEILQSQIIEDCLEDALVDFILNNFSPEQDVMTEVLKWETYKGKQIIDLIADYIDVNNIDVKNIKCDMLFNHRTRVTDEDVNNAILNIRNFQGDDSINQKWRLLTTHLIFVNNKLTKFFDVKNVDSLGKCLNLRDRIHDVIYIKHLDISDRERAFVYLNGKIIFGKPNQSHGEIVNAGYHRPDVKNVAQQLNAVSLGFGHYANQVVAINAKESDLFNVSYMEIADAVLENGNYIVKKIYIYRNNLIRIY